ncbi:hypothetical protein CUN67_30200 (plasmid) [Pantoea cypripedii]|uniref:Uncharacterized protein n=1 Tax=Pantoea cypripedii TaxID=55209 RepID=A0A6B9GBC0_PANCY|nr:hypothetical protein CUN67_30200 [Pantoea cypripedii]
MHILFNQRSELAGVKVPPLVFAMVMNRAKQLSAFGNSDNHSDGASLIISEKRMEQPGNRRVKDMGIEGFPVHGSGLW